MRFVMLCRARQLDPWVGDGFLIGYDAKDGPQFSLITSFQALLKRAELHSAFDGLEAGVVIQTKKGIEHREGELVLGGETVVGAWAIAFRKDRSHNPRHTINMAAYNKGHGIWRTDPAGMLLKCAKAKAIREAFPSSTGGLYVGEEMGTIDPPTLPVAPHEITQDVHDAPRQDARTTSTDAGATDGPRMDAGETPLDRLTDALVDDNDAAEAMPELFAKGSPDAASE